MVSLPFFIAQFRNVHEGETQTIWIAEGITDLARAGNFLPCGHPIQNAVGDIHHQIVKLALVKVTRAYAFGFAITFVEEVNVIVAVYVH